MTPPQAEEIMSNNYYSLDSDTYAQMRYELEPLSPVCQMCQ